MSHKTQISYSQINTFLTCGKKWEYEYVQELAPRIVPHPLQLGTLVHRFMEAVLKDDINPHSAVMDLAKTLYQDNEYNDNVYEVDLEVVSELSELACQLGEMHAERFLSDFTPVGGMVEHSFRLPAVTISDVEEPMYFVGTIDAVVQDRSGRLWVLDHKVRKQLQPTEHEEFNTQMAGYQRAVWNRGLSLVGTIIHQIYAKLPKTPKVNQNGSISKADIRTTWDHYRKTVLANGQDPNDYLDMAEKLSQKEFYRYSSIYRSVEELDSIWSQIFLPTIQAIHLSYMGLRPIQSRSMSARTCTTCQFKSLCLGELRGYDVDYIRNEEYVKNSYLNKYVESEQELEADAI